MASPALTPQTSSPTHRSPDWLADAVRSTIDELRLFARTLWAITVRPRSFASAWVGGREAAVNPLAFVATTSSLLAAMIQTVQWLGLPGQELSFAAQLLRSLGPFLQYAAAGALAHAVLFAVRPRRRLLDSVAIGLYAGGSALVTYVLVMLVPLIVIWLLHGRPDTHGGPLLSILSPVGISRMWKLGWVVVLVFARTLWLSLVGLRGGRWVASGLGVVVALAALAVFFGKVPLHDSCGMHVVAARGPAGWQVGLED